MTLNLTAEERLHCQVMQACLNAIQKDKPLILKGGTALMLGYGLERFSEDLDFDIADTYTGKGTIKLDSVLKNALPYGVELQELVLRKDTPSVTRYILRYQQNCISDKLKIEVSCSITAPRVVAGSLKNHNPLSQPFVSRKRFFIALMTIKVFFNPTANRQFF